MNERVSIGIFCDQLLLDVLLGIKIVKPVWWNDILFLESIGKMCKWKFEKNWYKHSLKSIIEMYQRNRNNNSDAKFVLFSHLHNQIYVSLQIDQV